MEFSWPKLTWNCWHHDLIIVNRSMSYNPRSDVDNFTQNNITLLNFASFFSFFLLFFPCFPYSHLTSAPLPNQTWFLLQNQRWSTPHPGHSRLQHPLHDTATPPLLDPSCDLSTPPPCLSSSWPSRSRRAWRLWAKPPNLDEHEGCGPKLQISTSLATSPPWPSLLDMDGWQAVSPRFGSSKPIARARCALLQTMSLHLQCAKVQFHKARISGLSRPFLKLIVTRRMVGE